MTPPRVLRVAPATEEGRAALWRGIMRTQHGPEEARLARAWRVYLRDVARRYADRLGDILPEQRRARARIFSVMEWASLFQVAAEAISMGQISSPIVSRAMRRAFRWALDEVGGASRWEPELSPLELQIGELVDHAGSTSRAAVRRVVTEGLEDGSSVSDMQAEIMRAAEFRPARALMIARTETTRALSAGTDFALEMAVAEGISVRRQWLSARDPAVRATHRAMDGQTIGIGERFSSPSGAKAKHPGGFGAPGEDINCRCTVLPFVD